MAGRQITETNHRPYGYFGPLQWDREMLAGIMLFEEPDATGGTVKPGYLPVERA